MEERRTEADGPAGRLTERPAVGSMRGDSHARRKHARTYARTHSYTHTHTHTHTTTQTHTHPHTHTRQPLMYKRIKKHPDVLQVCGWVCVRVCVCVCVCEALRRAVPGRAECVYYVMYFYNITYVPDSIISRMFLISRRE